MNKSKPSEHSQPSAYMKKTLTPIALLAGAMLSACESGAQSVTVWNTFGEPGNTYYVYGGPSIIGTSVYAGSSGQSVACAFTPSASGYLDTVSIASGAAAPPPTPSGFNGIDVYVDANNNNLPGTVLDSFLDLTAGNFTVTSSLEPFLSAGVTYWLCLQPSNPNTDAWWNFANNNPSNESLVTTGALNAWNPARETTQPEAFEVTVSEVPEPSTISFGVVAASAFLFRRRK